MSEAGKIDIKFFDVDGTKNLITSFLHRDGPLSQEEIDARLDECAAIMFMARSIELAAKGKVWIGWKDGELVYGPARDPKTLVEPRL